MRTFAAGLGWALLVIGAALICAGILATLPAGPDSRFSAAQQVQWSLARGLDLIMLGLAVWVPGLLALILRQITPDPALEHSPAEVQGAILRIARAVERQGGKPLLAAALVLLAVLPCSPSRAQQPAEPPAGANPEFRAAHLLARSLASLNDAWIACRTDREQLDRLRGQLRAKTEDLPAERQAFITGYTMAAMEEGFRRDFGRDRAPGECADALARLARAELRRNAP